MAKKKKGKFKFSFGTEFQELILQFIVTDPKGYKALELLDDTYFTLIHHAVICYGVKKYYKKKKKVPNSVYLKELLRTLYETGSRQLSDLSDEDRQLTNDCIDRIYSGKVVDEETIMESIIKFAQYVKFKEELETTDIDNFDGYVLKAQKFNEITTIGRELQENYGTWLVAGMPDRAHKRNTEGVGFPTPFWQLNSTMNSGGTAAGNLITIIAEEKSYKTGLLINIGKGYMKQKKKVIYFDFENGERNVTTRSEQSVSGHTREEILSEQFDEKLLKLFRKYKRLGAEIVIKRFPALTTTAADLQKFIDKLRIDKDFVPEIIIVDYGLLMAAISGKSDDFGRISDAFLDLKNLADHNNLQALWTVAHVTREASKRTGSKFKSTDIAKCIDIPRHVDILLGLQQSEEEKEAGVVRLEVLEQRDGREGRILLWADLARQRLKEFNKKEVKEYEAQLRDEDEDDDEDPKAKKRRRKTDL